MEESGPGYVKPVTFIFLVQNRFIFAMFCNVVIYLFIEHIISIFPVSGESDFLANEMLLKIDCIRVLIKQSLIVLLNRS